MMQNLHYKTLNLFNKVQDLIKPLESGPTVTEPHLTPEEDRVKHQVSNTHVQLVCHSEPLLGPHKLPLPIAQCF